LEHLTGAQRADRRDVAGCEPSTVRVDQLEVVREDPALAANRIAEDREVVARASVGDEDLAVAVEHDHRDLERGQQLVARERGAPRRHAGGLTTNSPKRVTDGAGRRARNRLPPSACTSTNTSPSRCSAATTSPRSYGTSNSTIGASDLSRAATVSKSTVVPSP